MRNATCRERGFSLVELLVAMVVTMLIAGGIFGLLYDSNRTFGREPAVSEQQQNARIALSLIESDLISAGAGAGAFAQVFTEGFDNLANSSDGRPVPPSAIRTLEGAGGQWPDSLEIRAAVDECQTVEVCSLGPGTSATTMEVFPQCLLRHVPGLVQITNAAGQSVTLWSCNPGVGGGGGAANCPGSGSGANNGHMTFPPGSAPTGCVAPGEPCNNGYNGIVIPPQAWMTAITKVRYEVRLANDGVPSLWRSPTGGAVAEASGACLPPGWVAGTGDWQLVARGIEDLQVKYRNGNILPGTATATWADDPGPVGCQAACTPTVADYNSIVREVEVRISSRVLTSSRLQGEINVAGSTARRAELRTVVTPRAAMLALQGGGRFY